MSVSFATTTKAINLDATVSSITLSNAAWGSATRLLVHVAVKSSTFVVSSITDSAGNTYVKKGQANNSRTFTGAQYGAPGQASVSEYYIDGELWANSTNVSAPTTITVNLTGPARFAVIVAEYTATTGYGSASVTTPNQTTSPSISMTLAVSTSFLACGFSVSPEPSLSGTIGTIRDTISGSTAEPMSAVGLTVADVLGTSSTVPTVVTLAEATFNSPGIFVINAIELKS